MMLQKIKSLPDAPGIYQFFDEHSKLLYVGKAKSLKNRVKSYFRLSPTLSPAPKLGLRIHKMICETISLNYIVVQSESDALILENSLIKQLNPKYNILLRDDKTYPYIFVDESLEYPRLEITRRVVAKDSAHIRYFGPFVSGSRDLLDAIYENFQLVQKQSCLGGKKACLFYQIKRCLAPCQFAIDKTAYKAVLQEAIASISNPSALIAKSTQQMHSLAEELRFEEAAKLKERIAAISSVIPKSLIDLATTESFDLIAISKGENEACVVRFFIRNGRLISSSHSFVRYIQNNAELFDMGEVYSSAIAEYYLGDKLVDTQEIVVADDFDDRKLLQDMLRSKLGAKLKIVIPTGNKKGLCEIAVRNGFELLKNRKNENSTLLYELKNYFKLSSIPFRIEVFDNSHLAFKACVAGMVVWEDGFSREHYRHYNLDAKDEYSQMKEVLTRRAQSFDQNPPPDLWVLDGGKANFALAKEIIASSGANVDIVAIAKEKRDAKAVRAKSKADDKIVFEDGIAKLASHDPKLLFLQKLRDEAHRYAIGFHRKQKLKNDKMVSLMKINGIKEGKIAKLVNYFGSFEVIAKASELELAKVVSANEARSITEFFQKEQK